MRNIVASKSKKSRVVGRQFDGSRTEEVDYASTGPGIHDGHAHSGEVLLIPGDHL